MYIYISLSIYIYILLVITWRSCEHLYEHRSSAGIQRPRLRAALDAAKVFVKGVVIGRNWSYMCSGRYSERLATRNNIRDNTCNNNF